MLVSVLMLSYNHERYIAQAIESVLGQTHGDLELVVVDDGSADDSRSVIESFGSRLVSVFKKNGGQASALNIAFERSRGELLCLMDSDDLFARTKVQEVVAAARAMPDAAMIQHQLQLVDQAGVPIHAPFPRRVPHGDLRSRARRSGGWFPHIVSSGLAFRRSYADRLFPIPGWHTVRVRSGERRIKTFPDTYLSGPARLLAPVAGIQAPLASYRIHGANEALQAGLLDRLVQYEAETEILATVMRERFGQPVELQLDRHVDYQLLRCAAREISRGRAAARVLRSPSLPTSVRVREVVRLGANRGPAARRARPRA
jgi:hypothetical protein